MSDESEKRDDIARFEQAATRNTSLLREILGYVQQNKKWVFLPILAAFLLLGALLVLSGTAAAPFIYTLF